MFDCRVISQDLGILLYCYAIFVPFAVQCFTLLFPVSKLRRLREKKQNEKSRQNRVRATNACGGVAAVVLVVVVVVLLVVLLVSVDRLLKPDQYHWYNTSV